MSDPKKPADPPEDPKPEEPDLSDFAVFDPDAGEALIRKRLNVEAAQEEGKEIEFPKLMGDDTITRAVAARWKAMRDVDRRKDPPDPWPLVERNFPRIAAHIRAHWGKRALDDYFAGLVIDDRGSRQGFPMDVLAALMEIARLHADQFNLEKPILPWEADVSETKWWYKN